MTENEAIVFIKIANEFSKKAIHNLEQIEDKAERIGKIGEYYANLENCYKEIESCEIAVKALEEIQQYRAISTVEECRAAIEKQKTQPPNIWGDGCDKEGNIIYDMYDCPGCGQSYEIDDKYKHCPECGQAINWNDLERL